MNIKLIRRISQITFFIIIIFGGYLASQIWDITSPAPPRGTEEEINLIDYSLPIRTCRYVEPKPTLFESCGLRFLLNQPLANPPLIAIFFPLIVLLILYFIFGRFMCGWMCPLGFVSDMLDWIRGKLRLDRITLPNKLKKGLKFWRYSFLLFLIFIALAIITPFIEGIYMDKNFYELACQVCPARTILPLLIGKTPTWPTFLTALTSIFSTLSLIFLGIYVMGLFITRGWCRICPNGTFTSLFNKGALIVKHKDVRKCTKCGICKRVCPFDNDHVFEEKINEHINHPNCIMCFNCINKCPEKDCLYVTFLGKRIFSSNFKKGK